MKKVLEFDGHKLWRRKDGSLVDTKSGTVLNWILDEHVYLRSESSSESESSAYVDTGFSHKKVWKSEDGRMSYKEYSRENPACSLRVFIYPNDKHFRRFAMLTEGRGNIPKRFAISSWYAFCLGNRRSRLESNIDDNMYLLGRTYLYPVICDRNGRCKELTVISREPVYGARLRNPMSTLGLAFQYDAPDSVIPQNFSVVPADLSTIMKHTPEAGSTTSHRVSQMTADVLKLFNINVRSHNNIPVQNKMQEGQR